MKRITYTLVFTTLWGLSMAQTESDPVYRSKTVVVNTDDFFAPAMVAPQITWEKTQVQLEKDEYMLKACILNKPDQFRLELNGTVVPMPDTRSFAPVGTYCAEGVVFSHKIRLQQGRNTAVLIAGNKAGEVRSEPMTLVYEAAEKRIALVIGNSEYPNGNRLPNPVNDAAKIAQKLRAVGFEVLEKKNTTQSDLRKIVAQFGSTLQNQKYDVALLFYAGHGMSVGGKNYLIPIDITPESETEVKLLAVSANDILEQMNNETNHERTNVMILDACRDNPLTRSWTRSTAGKGLADMSAQAGSLIAFSTKPGDTALDGNTSNSPYTEELIKALDQPGMQLEDVFKSVRVKVMQRTGSRQIPTETSLLTRTIILNKTGQK
ncbi:MAG: peptidase C14 caspase catalytic subunit p20 [Cytophagales bacterium]|nr:MAG: peptidase C14 caspase catalytic subunit p20 [Cytophagales bacterium]